MKLRSIYRKLYRRFASPLDYAKKVGVNFKGRCRVYGNVGWGSEPWIITIGDNCYITAGAKFITHDGGTLIFRDRVPDLEITKPIVLGDNVYLGNNVTIMPGVTIGNNVVVGAGSIVTKDVPDNSVVAGVPARFIKTIDEYFEKLQRESIHLGHLEGEEKDIALRKHFGYEGDSKGIYF